MNQPLENPAEQLAALTARPADAPVLMVNLLKFRPNGGLESYRQYSREVAPHLQRVGGVVRYAGTAPAVIIGEGKQPWWDAILVVEYPTPSAFIEMVSDPDYARVHEYRAAALEQGDLIATSTWELAD